MTDPFAPVDADPPEPPAGELQVARAVADGLASVPRNVVPLGGLIVALPIVYVLSFCTCVGWIFTVPFLLWGGFRIVLAAADGRARLSGLFHEGFAPIWTRGWGIVLVWFLLSIPIYAITLPFSIGPALRQEAIDPTTQALLSLPAMLWGFVICRLMFAPWLVIERATPVLEAFGLSWRTTARAWPKLIGLQLLLALLSAPATVLMLGSALIREPPRPGQPPEFDPLMLLAIAITGLTSLLGLLFYAAAYRQIFGRAPAAATEG